MEELLLNGKLVITLPDGLKAMSDEETANLNFYKDRKGLCLNDPERHIMITAGFKKLNGIINMLVSEKDLNMNSEAEISKAMEPYGYHLMDLGSRMIAGSKAESYSYVYNSEGTDMFGESYVFRKGKDAYYLNLYTRAENKEENLAYWNAFLDDLKWKD